MAKKPIGVAQSVRRRGLSTASMTAMANASCNYEDSLNSKPGRGLRMMLQVPTIVKDRSELQQASLKIEGRSISGDMTDSAKKIETTSAYGTPVITGSTVTTKS